jgi:hypothetical protein
MTTTLRSRNGRSPVIQQPLPSPGNCTRRRWQHGYAARVRVTDSVIVFASVMLAQIVRFGDELTASGYTALLMTSFSLLFVALWMSFLAVFHTRSTRIIGAGVDEYRRIVSASWLL